MQIRSQPGIFRSFFRLKCNWGKFSREHTLCQMKLFLLIDHYYRFSWNDFHLNKHNHPTKIANHMV